MGHTVVIAEKPTIAKILAQGLGLSERQADSQLKSKGHAETNEAIISFVAGHFLELAQPHHYDERLKGWRFDDLPIIPDRWKMLPRSDAKKQIGILKKLVAQADEVVNFGDSDREGQLLVDEIIDYFGYKGKQTRIWASSMNPEPLAKAFHARKPNAEYRPLGEAALARSKSDWLVGMNMTRAMTLVARDQGFDGLISEGRVQTPALALVAQRDLEIEHFKPKDYYVPKIEVEHPKGTFVATWVVRDDADGIDPENRLVDKAVADKLINAINAGKPGEVLSFKKKVQQKAPPLPYSLSTLTNEATKRLKCSAKSVLQQAQALYMAGEITYPRTDSNHLEEGEHPDAGDILVMLEGAGIKGADGADSALKSRAYDDKKMGKHSHGAMVPTGKPPADPSDPLYRMIAERFVMQFYPPEKYESQNAVVKLGSEQWKANGKRVLDPGWKGVFGNSEAENEEEAGNALPAMADGDGVKALQAFLESKRTQPPKRFTEGTLNTAMGQVHKFVPDDSKIKKLLRDNDGIGTEASRADIIETLKKRNYIQSKGGKVISTKLGREVVKQSPATLTAPATTALWERRLESVSEGKLSADQFVKEQAEILVKLIDQAKQASFSINVVGERHDCPKCGARLKRLVSKKNKKVHFWVCTAGKENCDQVPLFDDGGKPGAEFGSQPSGPEPDPNTECPDCKAPMKRMESKKSKGRFFWVCSKRCGCPPCADDNGKPGEKFDSGKSKKSATGKSRR